MQEGLTATLDQLRGCWEEFQSFQVDQLLPVMRASQADTARVASAVEGLGQGILTMVGKLQAMAESQQATAEGLSRLLEILWPMAERLESLQEIQRDSTETQRAMAATHENVTQSQRATAEGLQSLAQFQRATAEGLQSMAQSQRALAGSIER